jgi:thiol-disulfide isomerase/thioredoxin
LIRSIVHSLAGEQPALPVERRLASFAGATWLNSLPLTPEGFRGQVVAVDFWTYTCVNWLRTLPYVRAWTAKYADAGLTVVGVHTPEFGFEHDVDNVTAQARTLAVEYPVAVDNNYAVWRAFSNRFWPALYIADAEGAASGTTISEGASTPMAEMVIQQLLTEAGRKDVDRELVRVEPRGLEVAADWQICSQPRPTWVTARAPDSPRSPARSSIGRTSTPRHRGCRSTPGTSPGQSRSTPRSSTSRGDKSRSSSTPAMSTS